MRRAALIAVLLAVSAAGLALPSAANAGGSRVALLPVDPQIVVPTRPRFRVFVVEDFSVADLRDLAAYGGGAVGLLVPGVGALTDRHVALESLVRGADVNPYIHFKVRPKQQPMFRVIHREGLWPLPHGRVILLGLPPGGPLRSNETRYPIAIFGAGYHGLLTSPTTRIPGLVSIVDVAPTALGHVRGYIGHTRDLDPVPQLRRLDGQISANNRLKLTTLIILACTLVLLAILRPVAALPAVLAALSVNLVAGAAQVASEPMLVTMMFLGTLVGGVVIARFCRREDELLAAILAVLLVYTVLLALRPAWVAITPLGPTQNARFWGIGNQLETILLAPVVAGAAIASRRFGLLGFSAFAALALVLVTDNRLGSDGGGAIVFGVALAFVGARMLRLGWRGFLTLLAIDAAAVTAIIQLNLSLPGPDHLRSVFSNGVSGMLRVAADRIPLAYRPALGQWPILLPLGLFASAVFAAAMRATERRSRDLVIAASLALLVSLLVNDSGTYELAGGVTVLAALARASTAVAPGDGSPVVS